MVFMIFLSCYHEHCQDDVRLHVHWHTLFSKRKAASKMLRFFLKRVYCSQDVLPQKTWSIRSSWISHFQTGKFFNEKNYWNFCLPAERSEIQTRNLGSDEGSLISQFHKPTLALRIWDWNWDFGIPGPPLRGLSIARILFSQHVVTT